MQARAEPGTGADRLQLRLRLRFRRRLTASVRPLCMRYDLDTQSKVG